MTRDGSDNNSPPSEARPDTDGSAQPWAAQEGPADRKLDAGGSPADGFFRLSNEYVYGRSSLNVHGGVGEDGLGRDLSAQWAVPWSDLMMVMFVLFAVLFSMQLTERDISELFQREQAADAIMPAAPEWSDADDSLLTDVGPLSPEEILRQSERLIAETNLDNIDVALTDKQAIKVSVRGPMLFDLGKADLRGEVQNFLSELAVIISRNSYEIQVVGHTDNFPISTPEFPTNWELSAARAARVARYLIQEGNLEPGRFTVIGHSLHRPVVPNSSPVNKRKNRRVEIIITRNEYRP